MDTRRVILYAALAFVVYSLWTNWQIDYPSEVKQSLPSALSADKNQVPMPLGTDSSDNPIVQQEQAESSTAPEIVRVETDRLDVAIDLSQGNVIRARLLDYPESVNEKDKPFVLLQDNVGERYVANSNLFVVHGQQTDDVAVRYHSAKSTYVLQEGESSLNVTLEGKTAEGLSVSKVFTFKKGSYLIDVRYQLLNEGTSAWKGYMNMQLLRSSPQEDKSSMFHVGSYTGASYSNPGHHRYQKVSFKDMTKSNLDIDVDGGWIAMQQHYFLTAWVPLSNNKMRFYTRSMNGDYSIGAISQPIVIQPSQQTEIRSQLYVGPEITHVLKTISPGLDLTVDYGWLWFLSSLLFSLMTLIYSFVGNWGWSIVLVTVIIKLAFYRLSATSYKSMAGMRKLQPKLQALRERYGDDKAKISQETMALYRQEKVNPLGGCLPIVIQIPVFIGLYWVLLESVELRQAPFLLWINDLAAADSYHVLPVLMGITMLIQQKLNPAPPDPMQAKMMMFLPILFTGLFWNFPAGLVLYWIVNNTLSILQQWYITRKFSEDKPTKKLSIAK